MQHGEAATSRKIEKRKSPKIDKLFDFLKKDMILAEIDEWLKLAKTEDVQWCGFNPQIENRFK